MFGGEMALLMYLKSFVVEASLLVVLAESKLKGRWMEPCTRTMDEDEMQVDQNILLSVLHKENKDGGLAMSITKFEALYYICPVSSILEQDTEHKNPNPKILIYFL